MRLKHYVDQKKEDILAGEKSASSIHVDSGTVKQILRGNEQRDLRKGSERLNVF